MPLQQKVAVMTGAASGFGRVVAADMAQKGWKVVILDVRVAEGEELAKELDGDFFHVDVRSWATQCSAFRTTFDKYGRMDFVFANAGVVDRQDYFAPGNDDFDPEKAPDMTATEINFIGSTYTCLLGMKYLRLNSPPGGDIIMTSSGCGIYATAMVPYYCGAKHGVTGFGRAAGERLVGEGIRVNVLVPGMVETNLMPAEMFKRMDRRYITPATHLATAVADVLKKKCSGRICEASVDKLFYRDQLEFPDEAERYIIRGTMDWRSSDSKEWTDIKEDA